MPALQIREFPPDVYEELKTCAEEEHRSISQQALAIIEEFLAERKRQQEIAAAVDRAVPLPPKPWEPGYRAYQRSEAARKERLERRRAVFSSIDAREPFKVPDGFPSIEEIVREMRDER